MRYTRMLLMGFLLMLTLNLLSQESDCAKMDSFIQNLMDKMTLKEKIGQLNLVTPGGGVATGSVVSKGVEAKIKNGNVGGIFGVSTPEKIRSVQDLAVNKSRLKIPLIVGSDVIHGYKTTFPIPLAISCSWDLDLIKKTARVAAKEATADGIFWNFSPMVDISRDPRWGRVAEGAGEDPYLGAQIAKAMVDGYQGRNLKDKSTMMATVKHFALYGAPEAGKDYNSVDMSRLKMFNQYMPPYKAAVEAGVGCVMSSFNDVDGVPATGNKWLLTDVLRKQWGFKGFVVSDYTSVNEMMEHGMGNLQDVSTLALKAGLDMDMVGEGFLTTLEKSIQEGKIEVKDVEKACRRILEAKYKLGLFDDAYRYIDEKRPAKEILTKENRNFARKVAEKSFVLLKNENQTLPLNKKQKIALIGPLANDKSNMLGTWAPTGDFECSVPVLKSLKDYLNLDTEVFYAKGANISDDQAYAKKINVFGTKIAIDEKLPEEMLKEAIDAAHKSDVIVAIVGEASEMSGESSSRTNLAIPESQKKLVRALAKTEKPLVLVIMGGRPLTIAEEKELATSILYVWHPGIEAGNAIVNTLYGESNPAGKLTMSFPVNVGQIPIYYSRKNTGRPASSDDFEKFKTNYLDVSNKPLYPFGYGLSYTKFEYDNFQLSADTLSGNDTLTISVEVKNLGSYDGEEVVQLYTRDLVASVTRPLKELKRFKKAFIKKGTSQTVTFELTKEDLKFYNSKLEFVCEPGSFELFVGGSSETVLTEKFNFIK